MPDYEFTDPKTGRTLTVSGPTPPSEAMLAAMFADAARKSQGKSSNAEKAHPEAVIGPTDSSGSVTFGDLIDDPHGSMQRMYAIVKGDLTNPKLMLPIAAGALYGAYRGSGMGTGKVPSEAPEMPTAAPSAPMARSGLGDAIRQNIKLDDVVEMIPGAKNAKAAYRVVRGVQRALGGNAAPSAPLPEAAPASVPTAATPPTPPVEAPAPPPTEPVVTPKPKATRTAKPKAETTPDATGDLPSLDDLHLTPAEISTAVKWHENGVSPETILHRILQSRQLTARTRTETPDQAAEAVRYRNEHGRWQSEK